MSPSRSTRQFKNPVCPTVTVTLRWTLKSKYGSSAAGDIVVSDVFSETAKKHLMRKNKVKNRQGTLFNVKVYSNLLWCAEAEK